MKTMQKIFLTASIVVCVALNLSTGDAQATTINVNTFAWNLQKDGKCSFPEAVDSVNNQKQNYDCPAGNGKSDTIQLQAHTTVDNSTVYVATSGVGLFRNVSILGAGSSPQNGPLSYINGTGLQDSDGALIYVSDNGGKLTVTIQNVFLIGPAAQVSGIYAVGAGKGSTVNVLGTSVLGFGWSGIAADGINLNVQNALLTANSSPDYGGGIQFTNYNGHVGNLTISQSTLYDNAAALAGGGLYYNGQGTSSLTNSTIAYNCLTQGSCEFLFGNVSGQGGGIALYPYPGSFAINGCTIGGNSCGARGCAGGGIDALSNGGTASINASIIANNVDDPVDQQQDDWNSDNNAWVTESNSIIQASIWGVTVVDGGNNMNGAAALGPYQPSNQIFALGGVYPLQILMPPANSPAIDYLGSLSPAADERGFLRGVSVKGNGKPFDIGAVEFDPNTQAETMGIISKSAPVVLVSGSSYSNGKGAELQAAAIGDNVVYFDPTITAAGNYQHTVRFATGQNEGIVQLEWSSNEPGLPACFQPGASVVAIGVPTNLYAKTAGFTTVQFPGTNSEDNDVTNCLRFRVTGKDRNSTGYAVYIDFINSSIVM